MEIQNQPDAVPVTAYDQLRAWILSGVLSPGQRLPVRDVAKGLGLSTMPVREALVRLEEAGLVTQERHKGAVVSRLSVRNLNDCYDLRILLEPPSIRMGIERMTNKRLERLRTVMEDLDRAVSENDLTTVLDLDDDFLSHIHAAVDNKELARVIRSTWARVRPYKLLFTTTAQSDAGHYIINLNKQLLDAAVAGNGQVAQELTEKALVNAKLLLADLLRDHQEDEVSSSLTSAASSEPLASVLASLVSGQVQPAF